MSIKPTFLYHAQGCAFGGVMRRPSNEVLEAKAATALPQTGGVAFADETGFNYKNLFTFDKAATRASGTKDGNGTYKTTITATVEGLNMQGVLKATSIVASLTTRHNGSENEAHVDPSGSQFTGLTISGYPVAVDLDTPLMCQLDTLKGFRDKYAKDPAFRRLATDRFGWAELPWPNPDTLPEPKGIVSCSLVKTISCDCPGLTINGNCIKVPEFGTIYLAEYWAKAGWRQLTMMRFALGSPTEGDVTVGGINGNGTTYP